MLCDTAAPLRAQKKSMYKLATMYAPTSVYGVFTLLVNLHDFVIEPFNPVHIFRDAHTVPFCLTADHISTCLMSLCTLQASTVVVCSEHVMNGMCSISSTSMGHTWELFVRNHGVPREAWS